jgi:hypothetical protein
VYFIAALHLHSQTIARFLDIQQFYGVEQRLHVGAARVRDQCGYECLYWAGGVMARDGL